MTNFPFDLQGKETGNVVPGEKTRTG